MKEGCVLEVDPILGVEALPGIAPPPVSLGARPADPLVPAQPLTLADPRSFEIAMSGAAMIAADDSALEHGKHRR